MANVAEFCHPSTVDGSEPLMGRVQGNGVDDLLQYLVQFSGLYSSATGLTV